MSANNIIPFDSGTYLPGSKRYTVASGTTASINVGEFVTKPLASVAVKAFPSGSLKPSVTSTYLAGLAMSTSNETATAAGVVDVMPIVPGLTFLGNPDVAATWDTQAEYDALVGARVLVKVSGGVHTILASDSANNGLVVEPLDITLHPGKVRFSVRQGLMYNS